jgi:transposase InsO family protein
VKQVVVAAALQSEVPDTSQTCPYSGAATHTFTRPYRPATNGKVERFNRTLLTEWAYAQPWHSDGHRTRGLARWLHLYNHHRHHTAIRSSPISRVSNLVGHNI